MPSFSSTLEAAIHNALGHANKRKHELATLEHLLLALLDEPDAVVAEIVAAMKARYEERGRARKQNHQSRGAPQRRGY